MSTIAPASSVLTGEPPSLLNASPAVSGSRNSGRMLDADARRDLLIDCLLERLTRNRTDYRLEDWFTTLVPAQDVAYRQAVFTDLETTSTRAGLTRFCDGLLRVRRILVMAARLSYDIEKQRWFLEAALGYTDAAQALADTLDGATLGSAALRGLASWLDGYVSSPGFQALSADARELMDRLDAVRYRVRVYRDWVQVRPVDPAEPDLAASVISTFARFRQGAPKSYLKDIRDPGSMDHVEAAIASFVARLYPEVFEALKAFHDRYDPVVLPALIRVEREAQFYLAHLDLADETAQHGVRWSLPDVASDGELAVRDAYDVVMLLGRSGVTTVPNGCQLAGHERVVVVTGPNQGGKTTFARTIGQLHLLAATGAPVPAAHARVPLVDDILTVFERGENLDDLRGHLQDDLTRARTLLGRTTPKSLVLLNEVYSSTSPGDANTLASDLLTRLEDSGARCVCVTFLDELSRRGSATVSMVAGVDPHDPTRRTYRVERRPADGLAYAHALAHQHGLTSEDLGRRLHR